MNFTSNTLGELGRGIGKSSPTTPHETNLVIPPIINLAIEPRGCTTSGFGSSGGISTAVMNDTWSGATYGQTLNNGPLSFLGSQCAAGLWRIDWTAHFTCDFVNLAAVSTFGMQNVSGSKVFNFVTFGAGIINTNLVQGGSCMLLFDEPYQPIVIVAVSGAAQHTNLSASWICHRIIQ